MYALYNLTQEEIITVERKNDAVERKNDATIKSKPPWP